MKIHSLLSVLLLLTLAACQPAAAAYNLSPRAVLGTSQPAPRPSAAPSATPAPLKIPTTIPTTIPTPASPTATLPGLPTSVPAVHLVKQGPGSVTCPILLYHLITYSPEVNPYAVSPLEFRGQMQALKDWGYTSISISQLVEAINFGAKLPERPVVITFDDGDESVYEQAYPVMRDLGFIGVNYLVVNYIGAPGHMTVDQLGELSVAGWEVGSHSMTHVDLTRTKNAEWELVQSRPDLEKLLGVKVATIAYPFGRMSKNMLSTVAKNYRAGLGLGVSSVQTRADLYYLWRRPVEPGWDLRTFGSFLPWHTPPAP